MKQPRILIACEVSGRVRDEFAERGFKAVSADLSKCESQKPGAYYVGDVLDIIDEGWDAMIAFPPCTFLCGSGMHWTTRGLRDPQLTEDALEFVRKLMDAPIPFIALENPVGVISTRIRKPDQQIQPYQFGEDASKRTCLWLKNLPKLVPTELVPHRIVACGPHAGRKRWSNQTDSGQNKLGPSERRAADRAITYRGVARAMAEQWGPVIKDFKNNA